MGAPGWILAILYLGFHWELSREKAGSTEENRWGAPEGFLCNSLLRLSLEIERKGGGSSTKDLGDFL